MTRKGAEGEGGGGGGGVAGGHVRGKLDFNALSSVMDEDGRILDEFRCRKVAFFSGCETLVFTDGPLLSTNAAHSHVPLHTVFL